MPETRRKQLILVGHSLGAAIVLDILDYLAEHDMKISEAALLGAPVPDDALSVFRAFSAVEKRLSNVAFSGDAILKLFYPWHLGKPLGIAGWRYAHPRFAQTVVKPEFSFTNHYAYIYLENSFVTLSFHQTDGLSAEEINSIIDMVNFSAIS